MGELTCSKRGCSRKIKYQHIGEGGYYCKGCAYSYFNVSEFEKIGSAEIIKLMIELSKNDDDIESRPIKFNSNRNIKRQHSKERYLQLWTETRRVYIKPLRVGKAGRRGKENHIKWTEILVTYSWTETGRTKTWSRPACGITAYTFNPQ